MHRVLFVLVISLAFLAMGCIGPNERRPGFRLPGEVAAYPADWGAVVAAHPLIAVEVRTPYWIPNSISKPLSKRTCG